MNGKSTRRNFIKNFPFMVPAGLIAGKEFALLYKNKKTETPDRLLHNHEGNPVTVPQLNDIIKMLEQRMVALED